MTCEFCNNLKGLCVKHKPKETLEQRAERKALFIARATKHLDSPELREEASLLFEKANI